MPVVESRPFLTPPYSSVSSTIELVGPASVDQLPEVWSPGNSIVVRGVAILRADFWATTGIPPSDEVLLVGVASCLAARSRWRAQALFVEEDGAWVAKLELTADGDELAVELAVDLWVVGNGRTGSADNGRSVHRGAKLWQRSGPLVIPLDHSEAGFPTSAVSFSATGRRAVPWSVDFVAEAEPHWSISSSLRLYVNSDLDTCAAIVDGSAGDDVYAAIGCDIHSAVLHHLGGWSDSLDIGRLELLADDDPGCLAALGTSISSSLGISIDEACRLARDSPMQLSLRSREVLSYFQNLDTR